MNQPDEEQPAEPQFPHPLMRLLDAAEIHAHRPPRGTHIDALCAAAKAWGERRFEIVATNGPSLHEQLREFIALREAWLEQELEREIRAMGPRRHQYWWRHAQAFGGTLGAEAVVRAAAKCGVWLPPGDDLTQLTEVYGLRADVAALAVERLGATPQEGA